ncbi:hypothetical protein HDV05_002199 [Chytridiales sp. JEL 0842]|nr:hypothetical protein HDV05_002199 [Chytridiales sp. JEL 0842]
MPPFPPPPSPPSPTDISTFLSSFLASHAASTSFSSVFTSPSSKSAWISTLLSHISSQPSADSTPQCLSALRILSRDPQHSGPLFEESTSALLFRLVRNAWTTTPTSRSVAVEGLKCLVNVLLGCNGKARGGVGEGDVEFLLKVLEEGKGDEVFLGLRLLFVLSAHGMNVGSEEVVVGLLSEIGQTQLSLLQQQQQQTIIQGLGSPTSLLTELLKLSFNLTHTPSPTPTLSKTQTWSPVIRLLPPLVSLPTEKWGPAQHPLPPGLKDAIHLLMNFELSKNTLELWALSAPSTKNLLKRCVDLASSILALGMPFKERVGFEGYDKLMDAGVRGLMEDTLPAVFIFLKGCVKRETEWRGWVKEWVCPDGIDRSKKLDAMDCITSRLIKLMTSISMENLKNTISEFLFELFDAQPNNLVAYVGYGNAAGYLFQNNLLSGNPTTPDSLHSRSSSTSASTAVEDAEEFASALSRGFDSTRMRTGAGRSQRQQEQGGVSTNNNSGSGSGSNRSGGGEGSGAVVDPITGEFQRPGKLMSEEWEKLSEEEKEVEAEKLVELFERLERTGVIRAMRADEVS